MKEKIFKILHNRKRMPGERFSDIEGKIENLVNQEVENRIAERMPSPSDKLKGLREYQFSIRGRHEKDYITEDFLEGVEWLRSRLSQKTDNLKENNNNGSTN